MWCRAVAVGTPLGQSAGNIHGVGSTQVKVQRRVVPAVQGLEPVHEQRQRRVLEQLQSLLDVTFLRRRSCDRKGAMPQRLKLRMAFRAPAAAQRELRKNYVRQQALIASRNPSGCSALEPQIRTQGVLDLGPGPRVNECHLFHGTSMAAASQILKGGFRLEFAGQSTQKRFGDRRKCMFAQGVYLSECASKADEYADDQGTPNVGSRSSGKLSKLFPIVLCRVVLGRILRVERGAYDASDPKSLSNKLRGERCDSLVADLEKRCGTYREYVLTEVDQIFPAYLLLYRRLHSSDSKRRRWCFQPT